MAKWAWTGLALLAGTLLGVPARVSVAQGLYTPGFPEAVGSLTGNEKIPADTGLPEGQSPQTEFITTNQLLQYISGGGGGSGFGQSFPANGTAIGAYYLGNMVYVGADASHNLEVNCVAGCVAGSGSFNNNADAVATSSTNGQAAAWLYAYNGATWDRLRDDGSKNLMVSLGAALPAGSNVLGAVTQSGSWNLGSISGSITLPTGAASSTLQSAVEGTVAAGTSATASILTGGVYNSSPITLTTGQGAATQTDVNGYLKVNIAAGAAAGGTSSTFGATFPSVGTALGASNGGNMVSLAADGSHNLNVNCVVGCSSSGGSSLADEGAFTQGTTSLTVMGGIFSSSIANLTTGQGGAVQLTNDRQMYVNLGKVGAVAVSTGAGATGTGSQRVGIAQDTTTIAGSAPGSAGSASANVVTVQGIASATPILATLSGTNNINAITGSVVLPTGASSAANQLSVIGPVGPSTPATNSILVGGIYNSSPPSVTTGQQAAAQIDSSGNLKITCQSGCSGSGGTAAADQSTFTQGTTSLTPIGGLYTTSISNMTSGQTGAAQMTIDRMLTVNLGKVGGTTLLTGAGAVGGGAPRVAQAQDTTTVAGSAPGSAGSSSAQVLSVQGITSMTPIIVQGTPGTSTMAAVTVTTGNTFQSALASSGTRKGCTLQYTGTTIGYVFFGATVSGTKPTSFQLTPGQTINCASPNGVVLTDNIAVTSATTSDTFVVNSQ